MATRPSSSSTSSTKECQVLQKYFDILSRAITDPVKLAEDLFKADLISGPTCMKANTVTSSRDSRNHYLLDELMIAVTINPTNLTKIISVLQCHRPIVSALAEQIKTDYGNMEQ